MLNRSYSGYVVAALFISSVAGWGVAWKNSRQAASAASVEENSQTRSSSSRGGVRPESRASIGSLMENPRSAKLFTEIMNISAAATPGKVNDKLVAACRATLTDPDPQSRSRDFALLLTQVRAEDAVALHQMFLALDAEGKPLFEYGTFATRWGEVDGAGALQYLMNEVPIRMPERDLRDIARGWGAKDPQAALAWMAAHEEVSQGFGGRGRIFEGWVRSDSDGATAWLLKQKQGRDTIDCVAGAMPEQLHSKDLLVAVKWLADLPDDGLMSVAAQQGWRTALNNMNELSYKSASNVWSEVRDQPWMGFDQFARLADQTSRTRTASEGLGGFLNELSNTWPADQVTTRFQQWSEANPDRIAEWLGSAPESPVRTAAIQGLIHTLEKTDPAAAAEWRRQIAN